MLVVFCGGAIGTAIRYAFAQIPAAGSFHTGTFVANMLACFCYAGLTAYLAGASRFGARSKELASRGLGMGVCGGLSTMSTLALEGFTAIRDGQVAAGIAYLLVTFALGLPACGQERIWPAPRTYPPKRPLIRMPLRPAREVRRDDRIPTNLGLPVRRRRRLLPLSA